MRLAELPITVPLQPDLSDGAGRVTHEIHVLCNCAGGVENCDLERYVSDVRIAHAFIRQLLEERRVLWGGNCLTVQMPTVNGPRLPVTPA